jgi:hypothetical protein
MGSISASVWLQFDIVIDELLRIDGFRSKF